MNVRLKRARELAGYAVQLTRDEGLPTMLKRGAGFVKRRCFGKRARQSHRRDRRGALAARSGGGFRHGRRLRPAHHQHPDPAV